MGVVKIDIRIAQRSRTLSVFVSGGGAALLWSGRSVIECGPDVSALSTGVSLVPVMVTVTLCVEVAVCSSLTVTS